jgi:hypothetical protein
MPLLETFEPELVVNSAGQDNHFNDPITNMNFSARGYAALNARLRPDIAVLEGGYAVEDALPYVNVGIIMAMAGLDTSFVKEPNYDRDYRPQPPEITRYIRELIGRLREMFVEGRLEKTACREGDILERSRDIYYDTDAIHERQHEKIRCCRACAGALSIASTSNRGQHILAVRIPVGACQACRETGAAWFAEGTRGAFTHVYLQDRSRGVFERT